MPTPSADAIQAALRRGSSARHPDAVTPRFQAGQRVLDVATGIGSRCCRRQVVSVPGKYRKN